MFPVRFSRLGNDAREDEFVDSICRRRDGPLFRRDHNGFRRVKFSLLRPQRALGTDPSHRVADEIQPRGGGVAAIILT
jgi:hypothetical protein